jgi:hypothetical protein
MNRARGVAEIVTPNPVSAIAVEMVPDAITAKTVAKTAIRTSIKPRAITALLLKAF